MADSLNENGCLNAAADRPRSILMYSHDGFGLGHLKRNFTIAKKILSSYSHCNALLLMGHNGVPFHPIPQGIDFIKLPSIIKVNDEAWQPRNLSMEGESFKNLRAAIIKNVAEHFQPDIFLVDYVPKGVWGELMPTLEYLKHVKKNTKIVLGLRDIIDEPEITRERWKKGNTFEAIQDFYDKVLIYGCPSIFDTAGQYGLRDAIESKIHYCGYLCTGETTKSPRSIKRELGFAAERLIVITAGGGGDAYPMMKQCMSAFEILHKTVSAEALFITGPLMKFEHKKELENMAESLPAKVFTSSYGIINYMNAADLLVTMGSYNTMMEAVKLSRPTLVVPREGPSAEQKIRAQLFSQHGYVNVFSPSSGSAACELAEAMKKTFEKSPPKVSLNMEGLSNAAVHLSEYLEVASPEKNMQAAAIQPNLQKEKIH